MLFRTEDSQSMASDATKEHMNGNKVEILCCDQVGASAAFYARLNANYFFCRKRESLNNLNKNRIRLGVDCPEVNQRFC